MTHHTENGYMRLATTLVDALLASDLSKREWQVLMFLFRRTYNFNQKWCRATSTYIAEGTGLHAAHVRAVLRDLEAAGCIEREGQMVAIMKAGFPRKSSSEAPKRTETVRTETVRTETVRQEDRNGPKNGPKQSSSSDKDSDTSSDTPLPPNVDPAIWAEWEQHRKEQGKKGRLTPTAIKRQFAFLAKQPDPNACILQSIQHGWQGIFELKTNGASNGNGQHETRSERFWREQQAILEGAGLDPAGPGDGVVVDIHGRIVRD